MPNPTYIDTSYNYNYSSNFMSSINYPNPYFDLSRNYHPSSAKELYHWCTYYYYSNPLVSSALNKISRYPITNPIIEEISENSRAVWEKFFESFELKSKLMDSNLDLNCYGNAYCSLKFPFTRYLKCSSCKNRSNINLLRSKKKVYSLKFAGNYFHYTCPLCKNSSRTPINLENIIDVPYKNPDEIKLIRWNPENILVKYVEATASSFYAYRPPSETKKQVLDGDLDVLSELPVLFINAAVENKIIRLDPKYLFHLKRPTLAEKDMGQGKPLIMSSLKDLFYQTTMRRAQEAIAKEHILPFDYIYPVESGSFNPYTHANISEWISSVRQEILRHRRDPNYKAVVPVPIGHSRLGGDGRALLLGPEMQQLKQDIVGGFGIPVEFLFGGLSWTGSSITLRSLSNDFEHNQSQLLKLAHWIKNRVQIFMGWPALKSLRFSEFRMADDMQRLQNLINLHLNGKISHQTIMNELSLNSDKEIELLTKETEKFNKIKNILIIAEAKANAESQLLVKRYEKKMQLEEQPGVWSDDAAQISTDASGDYINALANKMVSLPDNEAQELWNTLQQQEPNIADMVIEKYKSLKLNNLANPSNQLSNENNITESQPTNTNEQINMKVMGEGNRMPRRAGVA